MGNKSYILICILFVAITMNGCATRSAYGPITQSGGYSDGRIDDTVLASRFDGNAYTHPNDASLFAHFRAIEICRDKGFPIARFIDLKDLSTSKDVQKTYTYQNTTPTYFSGVANSNSNFNNLGNGFATANTQTNITGMLTGGQQQASSTSWTETHVFPSFEVYFICASEAFRADLKLKNVSPEEMKPFVKDLLGAIQIENVGNESPNRGTLKVGDIVTRVNGERVRDQNHFVVLLSQSKDKSKIPVTVIRDGKSFALKIKAVDSTDLFNSESEKIISAACSISEVRKRPLCSSRRPSSL